eukprot:1140691-Pelagomonas_calceolata.AAC.2
MSVRPGYPCSCKAQSPMLLVASPLQLLVLQLGCPLWQVSLMVSSQVQKVYALYDFAVCNINNQSLPVL